MSKHPELNELFFSKTNDFLHLYLQRQEQKSKETIKAYRISLNAFFSYVTETAGKNVMEFCFTDCTYDFVLKYSQYLQEDKKLCNSTVNQRIAALKSYLKYVADGDISLVQVYMGIQKVPNLKIEKLQRPIIEQKDLSALLDIPDDTKFGRRDRVLLILLFDTAIRVSELTGIMLGDLTLDVEHPTMIIHGKGKKTRCISLNQKCAEHVKNYVLQYHGINAEADAPLFYTVIHGEKNPMSTRNVERIVKKYADQVRRDHESLPESVYPHMFRRTRATGLYRDGVPLEMVSAILGHENSETTKIYAIPSAEQLRKALLKGQSIDDNQEKLWENKTEEIRRMFGLT